MKATLYVIDDHIPEPIGEVSELSVDTYAGREFLDINLPETFLRAAEAPPGVPGRTVSYCGFQFVQGFDGFLSAGGSTHES